MTPPPPPPPPLSHIIDTKKYPLDEPEFAKTLHDNLNQNGVVLLPSFLQQDALDQLLMEAISNQPLAFYTQSTHNIYLTPKDDSLPTHHIFNKQVDSSKGCIATDQISDGSLLKTLYYQQDFQSFLAKVVGVEKLYPYVDPLSEINVHYYNEGQELGWHFDNASFAITLLLQAPTGGGQFEYVPNMRDSSRGDNAYEMATKVVTGEVIPATLNIQPSSLVIIRGRDSLHRVTKVTGSKARIIIVFAYNNQDGVSLSEEARRTFYGRIGTET